MIPTPRDRLLLRDALVAVASSATMRDWERYVTSVEALRPSQVPQTPLRMQTAAIVALSNRRSLALPWHSGRVAHARLVAGLVSFADDYDGEPPSEILPAREAAAVLEMLRGRHDLDVTEQLHLALDVASSPLGAALALHLATRVLSRNRDTRLGLDLGLDERLELGRAIAPFDPSDSDGGDPLGDAYHYWANVAAGMHSAGPGERLERALVSRLFEAGPHLMRTVRVGLFRRRLFYGDHARIDRAGLCHGQQAGLAALR